MNSTNSSNLSVEEEQHLVNERFLPAMCRLAKKYGMGFYETPSKPEKRIASCVSGANICFRKPYWKHCYIYFEFKEKNWIDLQYGCGYWEKGIEIILNTFSYLNDNNIIRFQKNFGGAWICEPMDTYRNWDSVFFKDLVEREDDVVEVFERKIEKMLYIVKEFEHIL